jgi:hypothetical protein
MARTATHAITSDWDYDVEKVPAFTPEGKSTGSFMTRRIDNGTILKVGVSKDYNVVNNRDVMEPVQNVLADLGLEPTSEKHFVMGGGARFKARFEFKDTQVEIPKVGDTLGFRLDLDNSFNLMHRIRTIGGGLRLVCTNGMTTLDKEHGISCKHSNKFSVDNVVRAVKDALNAFQDLGKADNPFTLMASREVSQEQGLNILENLTKKGTISEVRREGIARIWNGPDHQEDEARNLYNLLNAATQFTTHEVAETNFEMSERLTSNITKQLLKAAREEKHLSALWTPVESDAVVVTA